MITQEQANNKLSQKNPAKSEERLIIPSPRIYLSIFEYFNMLIGTFIIEILKKSKNSFNARRIET